MKMILKNEIRQSARALKKSNEGLSLVELVVTSLIMGMVSLIIVVFVSASRNSYTIVNNEVTMQTEADMAVTYISNYAEQAMDYRFVSDYKHGSEDCGALAIKSPEFDSASNTYVDYVNIILFEKDTGILRFCKFREDSADLKWYESAAGHVLTNLNIDGTLSDSNIYGNKRKLLAQYISGFNIIDNDDFRENELIRLCLDLKYGGSVYSTNKNIYSRNMRYDS